MHCIRFCAKGTKIWVRERLKQDVHKTRSCLSQSNHKGDVFHLFILFCCIIVLLSTWCTNTNEISYSLLSGEANISHIQWLRPNYMSQVTWSHKLHDRATNGTPLPWMAVKCFGSTATVAHPSHSLWRTWLTSKIKSKTPWIPAYRSLKMHGVKLSQSA